MSERFLVEGVVAGTSVSLAAERILCAKADPLFKLEKAAAGGRDADAVHDMRVASRRLREALRLFAPVYRRKTLDAWYDTVSEVTRTLGAVRDADVFIGTFHTLLRGADDPAERAALAYVIGYRQAQRAESLKRTRKRLERLQLAKARGRFEKAIARARDLPDTRRPLRDLAAEALSDRLATMYGFLPAALAPENAEAQHAMRIACKRLRYALETFAPCIDDSFGTLYETLVRFQDVLGQLHDYDVFIAAVREMRAGAEAAAAGVTRQGFDEVAAGLSARRDRTFRTFSKLCRTHPETAFRAALLGAVTPAEPTDS